jgi:hypothetical protein
MTPAKVVSAIQHICRMRGGAQAHLLRASNGHLYVTKFQNNPQHVRVLSNELFASCMGISLGLPIPPPQLIEVSDEFTSRTNIYIEIAGRRVSCRPGLHLGSHYVAGAHNETIFDNLPASMIRKISNLRDFHKVLVLDKWLGNCDSRQAVFTRKTSQQGYDATFIDQGYCFNAAEWTFPDVPLHGIYPITQVYEDVTGWHSFEPVLTQIEEIDYADIWKSAAAIPHEWFEHDGLGLFKLIETLYMRRSSLRHLITEFRNSARNPFPKWTTICVSVNCGSRIRQRDFGSSMP